MAVRASRASFHLPIDAERVPLIMVAAGAGLAPFRGFLQERAAQLAAGRNLAPALLFFGCRAPGVDDLYRAELDRWETMGAMGVRRAYSSARDQSEGCRYVQDRLYRDRAEVMELWNDGAKVFVCGSRVIAEAVRDTILRIREEQVGEPGEPGEVTKWFESIRNERYATDVFD